MVSGISGASVFNTADLSALRQNIFKAADTDKSEGLSLSELQAISGQNGNKVDSSNLEAFFKAADGDGNGSLSQSELDKQAQAQFKNQAQNGGLLSGSTLLQLNGRGQDPFSQFFASADTDQNGGLNFDEFKAAKPKGAPANSQNDQALFDSIDTNKDGSVSVDELKADAATRFSPNVSSTNGENDPVQTLINLLTASNDEDKGNKTTDLSELNKQIEQVRSSMMNYLIGQQEQAAA